MAIKGTVQIGGEQTPAPNFNALLAPIQNQMAQNNRMRMTQAMKNMDRQYTEQESIRRENRQEDRLIEREGRHEAAGLRNTEEMARLNYRLQDEREHGTLIKNILAMAEGNPNLFEGIHRQLGLDPGNPLAGVNSSRPLPPGYSGPGGLDTFDTPALRGIFNAMSKSLGEKNEYSDLYQQYQQSSPVDQAAAGPAFNRNPQDLRYPHEIGAGGHVPYVNPNPGLLPSLPVNSPRSNANLGAQGLREVNQLGDRRHAAIPAFHKRIADARSALGMSFDAEALLQNSNVGDLQNLDSELQQRVRYHGELARVLDASGYQSDPHTFNDIPIEELQALLFKPGATEGGRDAFETYAGIPTNPGIPAPPRTLSQLRDQYKTQPDFVGVGPYRKFAGDWRADTAVRDHAESLDTYRGELETLWKTETEKSKAVIDDLEVAAIRAYKEDSLGFEDDDSSKPTRQDEGPRRGTPEARAITLDYLFREGNAATVKAWQDLSTDNSKLVDLKDRYTKAYATARGALLQAKGTPALWAQLRPETQKQLNMALQGKAYTSTGAVQSRRPR